MILTDYGEAARHYIETRVMWDLDADERRYLASVLSSVAMTAACAGWAAALKFAGAPQAAPGDHASMAVLRAFKESA